jgi:tetratricopeptide (TPR) repeat protein
MKTTNNLLLILLIVFQYSCGQSEKEININKVIEHFNNEESNKVINYTELLILESPTDHVSWMFKGRALFNIGEEQKGIEALNNAININPKYYKAYKYRAVMYNITDKPEKALKDINIALETDPTNIEMLEQRAYYYYKLSEINKSIEDYSSIIEQNSNYFFGLVSRSSMHKINKDYQSALKDLTKAI